MPVDTWLVHRASEKKIPAFIHDGLPSASLFEAEEQWCVERVRILKKLWVHQVEPDHWPESLHWDWARKAAQESPGRLEDKPDIRVFGVKAQDLWQGLILTISACDYANQFSPRPKPLVYIDFIESAPWNWELQSIDRTGIFKGVGLQLFECAVRWSATLGFKGRIGLHTLPQSTGFYVNRCHMHNFGPDQDYDDLNYLELDPDDAKMWLSSKR